MKNFILALLIMTMNLSLYAQTNEFENNIESNISSLEDMRNGDLIKHRFSNFGNPMDEVSSKLNNQFFISKTMNIVDSVIITGLPEHQFQAEAIGSIGKQTYTYDNKGKVILMLQEHWNDSTWANHEKKTYEYDSNGNRIMDSHGYWYWYNSSWLDLKNHYDYSGNGLLASQYSGCLKRIPNPLYGNPNQPRAISIAVDSCRKYSYTYDSNENMTLKLSEKWEDSTWTNFLKTTYTYNNDGNVILELRKHWQDSTHTNQEPAWINSKKTTYTYDNNGKMILKLFGQWTNSTWRNSPKLTYTYDNNENITMELRESLQDSTWRNSSKTIYLYDGNGNRILESYARWQGTDWRDSFRDTYTYNDGNLSLMLHELWDGTTWVTPSSSGHSGSFFFQDATGNNYSFRGKKVEVFYREITDVNENNSSNLLNYTLTQNYPNPFNPSTTIGYSLPQNSFVQLKVYDMLGREVANLVNKSQVIGNYQIEFDATNLTSGIYFYRLQSGNFTETKKLILLR